MDETSLPKTSVNQFYLEKKIYHNIAAENISESRKVFNVRYLSRIWIIVESLNEINKHLNLSIEFSEMK